MKSTTGHAISSRRAGAGKTAVAGLRHKVPAPLRAANPSLADLIAFESSERPSTSADPKPPTDKASADDDLSAASSLGSILEPFPTAMRNADGTRSASPSRSSNLFEGDESVTRRVLQSRLEASAAGKKTSSATKKSSSSNTTAKGSSGSSGAKGSSSAAGGASSNTQKGGGSPSWASALFGGPAPEAQMKRQAASKSWGQLEFAEPQNSSFEFLSQEAADATRELPPLQSILDLTSASTPPQRGEMGPASGGVGRQLADGKGELADGTLWEKKSGEERGENGLWKKWTVLRGGTADGKVQWEEAWWEVTDWTGTRELGARKSGNKPDGSAWREEWNERISHNSDTLKMVITRDAHKWARDAANDEWEEKWGEHYVDGGAVNKYADKWAKAGANVWHEKWGEDYPGDESCVKYTDKWAERMLEDGSTEQWGDKWTESFGAGKGTKHGEVWSSHSSGNRYNRWWNEEHYGDGRVRKYGNSTGGEFWDAIENMDTYYNPIPHFGFHHALAHSPKLATLPLLPRSGSSGGSDDMDGGIENF